MPDRNILQKFLLIAFATETLCITYLMKITVLAAFVSVIYFICGIGMAIITLYLPKPVVPLFDFDNRIQNILKFFLIAAAGSLICYFSFLILCNNPIDYHDADMLPVIKTMDKRFLNGEWGHVYDVIPDIWNGSAPIYLPAMWLPFAPAVALNIDVRWVTAGCLVIAFGISFLLISFKNKKSFIIILIAAMLLCWLLAEDDTHGLISFSEEAVVIVYYILLVLALISENIVFISTAACLCLLSRYAAIGWAPALLIYLVLKKKNKQALIFVAIGIFFLLFFLIIPFGWDVFHRLVELPSYYINFSKRVWHDSPETFLNYIGFAKFFGPEKMQNLHLLLICLSFIVPSAFVLFCYTIKKEIPVANIPLAALKLSLVIFYNFIDVPYMYLFFTSSFVSLVIASVLLRGNSGKPQLAAG
ncbi:MAG TPA: hypothetical protein VMT76_05010 [Puia sp.]|nr:hypothetical protein [Puia sp.]